MKKLFLSILIGLGMLGVSSVANAVVFTSNQVGTNPINGYYLQTDGSSSSWNAISGSGTSGPSTSTYVSVFAGTSTLLGYASFTYNSSTSVLTISNEIDIGTSPQKLYQDPTTGGLRYQDNAGDGNGKQSILTIHTPNTNPQESDLSIVRSGSVNTNASGSIWWDFSNQCYGSAGYTQLNCTVGSSPYGTFDEIQGINGSSSFAPFRIGWWNQNLGAEATNTTLEVQYNPSSSVAFGPWNDQSSTDATYGMIVLSTSTYNTNGILALASSTTGAYVFTIDNSGNASTSGIFNTAQTYDIGGSVKLSTNSGNTIVRSSNGIGLDINSNGTFGACSLCIATSGFIGIGTSTPTDAMVINATSGYESYRANSGAVQGYFGVNTAFPGANMGTITNYPIAFDVDNIPAGGFATSTGSPFYIGNTNKVYLNTNVFGGYLYVQADGSGDNGEDTILVSQAPQAQPQEADFALSRTDPTNGNNRVGVDWDSECYSASTTLIVGSPASPCADNYASIDVLKAGTGKIQNFAIRGWNEDLGDIADHGVFWMQMASNTSAAFGGYSSSSWSTNKQFEILTPTSSAEAFEIDNGTAGNSTFSVAPNGSTTIQSLVLPNVTSSVLATDANGNVVATTTSFSSGTTWMTVSTSSTATTTPVLTMSLPISKTSSYYTITAQISETTGGSSDGFKVYLVGNNVTSTLWSETSANCSGGGGCTNLFMTARIYALNSTSSQSIIYDPPSSYSGWVNGSFSQAFTSTSTTSTLLNLNLASAPSLQIYRNGTSLGGTFSASTSVYMIQ